MYICCSQDTTKIYQRDVALCLQEMLYKSDQDFPAIFHFASCANDYFYMSHLYHCDKKYSNKSSTLLPLRMLEFHPFVGEHS